MTDFETAVKHAAEKAVLKFVGDGGWLLPNYEGRMKVPAEWVADVWRLIDADKLKRAIAERLEQELADRMVNHMAAELATDIKQILSVQERREALRALARKHMDDVMQQGANAQVQAANTPKACESRLEPPVGRQQMEGEE